MRAVPPDGQRNRDHILDVAAEAFRSRPDVSMREVAARANLGRATVYRHFRDLHAIYEALDEEAIFAGKRVVRARLAAAASGPRPCRLGDEIVEAVAELVHDDARWSRSVTSRGVGERVTDPFAPIVTALLRKAQARGEVRADADVEVNALALVSLAAFAINAVQRRDLAPELALQPLALFVEGLYAT